MNAYGFNFGREEMMFLHEAGKMVLVNSLLVSYAVRGIVYRIGQQDIQRRAKNNEAQDLRAIMIRSGIRIMIIHGAVFWFP